MQGSNLHDFYEQLLNIISGFFESGGQIVTDFFAIGINRLFDSLVEQLVYKGGMGVLILRDILCQIAGTIKPDGITGE